MRWLALSAVLLCAPLAAQEKEIPTALAPAALEKTVSFLASDELGGRDTPSPGQRIAAQHLAERLRSAGLKPIGELEGFLQYFGAPALRLEAKAVELELLGPQGVRRALVPERDFRVLSLGVAVSDESCAVELRSLVDPARNRSPAGKPKRVLRLIEAKEDSPLWRACAVGRSVVRLRTRRPPVLLVRAGLLPSESFEVALSAPAAERQIIRLQNVVGFIPGGERADEMVLVSAHLDHIGMRIPRRGDDFIYNGADDDATGCAGVVHLAEVLAEREEPLPRSVAFACFTGEERGGLGSRAFAAPCPWPLQKIVANVNLEMLGRPSEEMRMHAWITGRQYSDFAEIVAAGFERSAVRLCEYPMSTFLFRASDNYAFARRGVVAHSLSASPLHSDYHQPSDEADRIDYEHMSAVLVGLHEALIELASRPHPPSYNTAGRKLLGLK